MRRNSAGRRGVVSGGPLLTEHLKDLDLELELLKRKREMIEQQHQLFNQPSQQYDALRQYNDYEHPGSYDPQQFDSNRDFSYMYDDSPSYGGSRSRKRHAEPVWEHEAPGGMFPSKKKGGIQQLFGSRLGPKPVHGPSNPGPAHVRYQKPKPTPSQNSKPFKRNPAPLMSLRPSIGQKIASQKSAPKPAQKNLTKVGKPKPTAPPNKIAAKPVAERAKLVVEATKSSAKVDESQILREDRVPTQQMTGRLELTLGAIMKEIKEVYGDISPYGALFSTAHLQRVMKQAIRERIRCVMLGKVVGSSLEIKERYRKEFPPKTDLDILELALDAGGIVHEAAPKVTVVEQENPDDVLKINLHNLIDARLKDMFDKLKDIYDKENEEKAAAEKSAGTTGSEKPAEPDFTEDNFEKEKEVPSKQTDVVEPTADEIGFLKNVMIKRLMPKLLKKYTQTIIKLVNETDIDEMDRYTRDAIIAKANKRVITKETRPSQRANAESNGEKTAQTDKEAPKQPPPLHNLPYYVKIKARPTLPKKKVMREFLDKFNTKSIKKLKMVHNLLFVGFSEKSDYDNILAANGITLARSVLEIAPSVRKEETNEDLNNSVDKILSPELDGQITDLLTSIRKANEEEESKDDGSDKQTESEKPESMDTSESNALAGVESQNASDDKNQGNDETVPIDSADDTTATAEVDNATNETEDQKLNEDAEKTAESEIQETAEKVDETSEKVDETPEKVVQTPEKAAAQPGKTVQTPEKTTQTPEKAAENDDQTSATVPKDTNAADESADVVADEKKNKVAELQETGRFTPTRVTRSANVTPGSIRTRRASRLAQNQ